MNKSSSVGAPLIVVSSVAHLSTPLDASPPSPPPHLTPRRDAALTHERRRLSMGGCTANVLNAWYAGIYHLQAPTDRSHSVLD